MPASAEWFDTGIILSNGETITIQASGDIYVGTLPDLRLNHETPDGAPIVTTSDPQFPLPFLAESLVPWSLVGRIGTNGQPFQVGSRDIFVPQTAGELYLSVNDNNFADNSGNWEITIIGENISVVPVPATNRVDASAVIQVETNTGTSPTNSPVMPGATNSIAPPPPAELKLQPVE
jgi:hypothetical protein